MKNFNKVLKNAATIFENVSEINNELVTIEPMGSQLVFTLWKENVIDYFEIIVNQNDEILLDTNYYIDLPKRSISVNDKEIIEDLIGKFYED